jgi:hypothetical protein
MPSLAHHHSGSLVKMLYMGDSKAGKTSSLISLVKAGFKLRILDLDNLLDPLHALIMHECPDLIDNVEFCTIRDNRKATSEGMVIAGQPRAYVDAVKMLYHWTYTDEETGEVIDYGPPSEWGPDCILVIDSLSRFCDACYDWRDSLTPKKSKSGSDYDGRAVFYDAQDRIEGMIAGLTAKKYRTNIILIAHVQYIDMPGGKKKGFPQGIGKALSPIIPQYFPSVTLLENKSGERTIYTASTANVDLANPARFRMSEELPAETGLAEFFRIARNQPEAKEPAAPPAPAPLRRPQTVTTIRR